MTRPIEADSAKTYDAIVDAALSVLDAVGKPSALSLRKVAAQAELSLGTVQYYFRSKAELLEACLDGYYGRMSALVGDLIVAGAELEGAQYIEHNTRELFRWARRERGLIKLRMLTNAERGELHPKRQADFMGTLLEQAAQQLLPHVQVGLPDTRLAIQSVSSIVARFALFTDSEIRLLTGAAGAEARDAVEDYVVRAARRLLRPLDG